MKKGLDEQGLWWWRVGMKKGEGDEDGVWDGDEEGFGKKGRGEVGVWVKKVVGMKKGEGDEEWVWDGDEEGWGKKGRGEEGVWVKKVVGMKKVRMKKGSGRGGGNKKMAGIL
jgi:hypothetical protein